ncbi:MAG: response regulator transcription factor [Burkholderiaceae bacterium]|jgi:DNA-binding response OmpR family regulator|nr:response regulator transcription factor [Burkholderiaceae bacterium]
MNILILDPERTRAERMLRSLSASGYVCRILRAKTPLFEMPDMSEPDILILNIGKTAKGLVPLIRRAKEGAVKKILLLAQMNQIAGVQEGLAAGADDYLCLPLRQHELQARVSVLARQLVQDEGELRYLEYEGFAFDKYPNSLAYKGKDIPLTAKEFDLALFLFKHIGMPLSRAHIAEAVWKMDSNDMARTIDTHVSRVRNRLGLKPSNGFLLEQVYGFGYRLRALADQ